MILCFINFLIMFQNKTMAVIYKIIIMFTFKSSLIISLLRLCLIATLIGPYDFKLSLSRDAWIMSVGVDWRI